MHTETNQLDFINHDCLSNDISVALLKKRLSTLRTKIQGNFATPADSAELEKTVAEYDLAQQFLCYA